MANNPSPLFTFLRTSLCLAIIAPTVTGLALHNSLGDGMVLQRDGDGAMLFGTNATGKITVTIQLINFAGTVNADGTWEVKVGPFPAGSHGVIKISDGSSSIEMQDVLWGDVILCSGQSNMVFSLNQAFSAEEALKEANNPKYQSIRLFTVQPTGSTTPIPELQKVEQPWVHANSTSLNSTKPFSKFSAVCWFAGRELFNKLNGTVPLGLFCSAFGGTRVHQWSSSDALKKCPSTPLRDDSVHYNAMINPILSMQFKTIFWLQGESDVNPHDTGPMDPDRGGAYYGCAIKAMVADWRVKFKQELPFIWVQLSPWVGHEAATSFYQLPEIRAAQMKANELPKTGYISAVDLGDPNPSTNPWGGVHFRTKAPAGKRLAIVVGSMLYGMNEQYIGPTATDAKITNGGVEVMFSSESLGQGLEMKEMVCPFFALKQPENIARCGWFEYRATSSNWTNTTAIITGDSIIIKAPKTTNAVRYLFADWPVATLYNKDGFPAIPFVLNVTK